ncbi:MAG TPA: aminodeoxychorismate synthase component I [Actinomycetota bacterium]|nr:aminodeoxychorismate synthase component I [Actinomycetota bacterium]
MIEARFDDLTGAEPSFRLVEPVGVLEATRIDEVAGVLAAADAAAARGLWVAGMVAYEAAPGLDPALRVRPSPHGDPFAELPLVWFAMFEGRQETTLPEPPAGAAPAASVWEPSVERVAYDEAIARIHGHIADGDTYQVNYTLRLRARVDGDPRGLYRDLCFAQHGRYAAYLDLGRFRVLSASPELFFRLDGDRIVTKPMKGTAPRGRWLAEDEANRERLLGSAKDRAENAMIVDLLRNDLGRIARKGSVTWADVFETERFDTVWQLTSTVAAELAPGAALADVFRALFPSGSVTGAPKVATMGIIADLEDAPRGVYCGAVGFLTPGGYPGTRARFNVAIRTVVQDAETRTAEYGVGGGITWDSGAAAEYDEVVAKARVLTAIRPSFRLLETLLHDPDTGYRRLPQHLARLRDSASFFGFAFDEDAVRASLEREARRFPDKPSRVRLLVDRRGRLETGSAPIAPAREPVRLAIDRGNPVDPTDVGLFHKTSARARYEEAAARFPDADDVVLVNTEGELTETTVASLAVRLDGRWWTPPRSAGLLPGCERAALLEEGTLTERGIRVSDLARAEGLAVLSSVRPWRAATLMD